MLAMDEKQKRLQQTTAIGFVETEVARYRDYEKSTIIVLII